MPTRLLELGTSLNSYQGDLNENYKKLGSSLKAGLKFNSQKRLNSHFQVSYGTVSGNNLNYVFTDENGNTTSPALFFKTRFFTLQYDLQVKLYKNKNWQVYVSQGLGLLRFSPKAADNQLLLNQNATRAKDEIYNTVSAVLPTQLGITYLFENGYGLNLQTGWLNPQTDYIDNISQWGTRAKKDNIWQLYLCFVVPLDLGK